MNERDRRWIGEGRGRSEEDGNRRGRGEEEEYSIVMYNNSIRYNSNIIIVMYNSIIYNIIYNNITPNTSTKPK
jgi:hypothetical protein